MPTPTPIQQIASEVNALKTKINSLQDGVRLTKARDAIEDIQTTINNMQQYILTLRSKGYVYEKSLETQAADFARQWAKILPNVQQQINLQSAPLSASLRAIEVQLPRLSTMLNNPNAARPILNNLQTSVNSLESNTSSVERTINGMYDNLNNQVQKLVRHLNDIEWMLTQISEASFKLMPNEAGIMAVKSEWWKNGKEQKDDPEGVLFLTDQRLIFEQKEEIATKKILFIATEKQKIQSLLLDIPVALVEEIKTSKLGMLKNEDHLDLVFETGAQVRSAHFHIWQDCSLWQGLINRARTNDFDKDRTVAIDQAELDKVKSAPTECPSCGGKIDKVILKGMDRISCDFCGQVIRL
jgi:ribosomal protein S27AE